VDLKLRLPSPSPPVIELEASELLSTYSDAGEVPTPDDGTANLNPYQLLYGARGSVVVKALCYKP
jgi:hypothetical protein